MLARGQIVPLYDQRILAEYEEVIRRPKFPVTAKDCSEIMDMLTVKGKRIDAPPMNLKLPDQDDLPFIEIALAGQALALITGNQKDFPPQVMKSVKVLSPRAFLDSFQNFGKPLQ